MKWIMMNIAIIGGGSIGLLYARYLSEYYTVCLYVKSNEQKNKINNEGLQFEKDGHTWMIPVQVRLISEWEAEEDLAIITVKQYHLPEVMNILTKTLTTKSCSLLFLQNGMGHLKWLDTIRAKNIYVASVEHGANRMFSNRVIHTGAGMTKVAMYKGESLDYLEKLVEDCQELFPFIIEGDYQEMLVKKLVVNSIINPMTAVLKIPNGDLLENPHYYTICKELFKEICNVLDIPNEVEMFSYIENICRRTAANRSSMLQDLDAKRPTEVDAILGYILERAEGQMIDAPIVRTFYRLIKGREY